MVETRCAASRVWDFIPMSLPLQLVSHDLSWFFGGGLASENGRVEGTIRWMQYLNV